MKRLTLSSVAALLMTASVCASGAPDDAGSPVPILPPPSRSQMPDIVIEGVLGSAAHSGEQDPRIYRDGIPSRCGTQKTCGVYGEGPYAYDAFRVDNIFPWPGCVGAELELHPPCPSTLHLVTYLGSFDPMAVCDNDMADIGMSAEVGSPARMVFDCPVFATMIFVVSEPYREASIGCRYTLTIELYSHSTPVEPTTWGAIKALY